MAAWSNAFYIGTNLISNFTRLDNVLVNSDEPNDPDCTFQEFGGYHDNADGSRTGIGFPRATLNWAAMSDSNVEILKSFCAGLSALVYWRIPTNRYDGSNVRIFRTYLCRMLWMPAGEDKVGDLAGKSDSGGNTTQGVTIELRGLLIQAEAV